MKVFDASYLTDHKHFIVFTYTDYKTYPDDGFINVYIDGVKYTHYDVYVEQNCKFDLTNIMEQIRKFGKDVNLIYIEKD